MPINLTGYLPSYTYNVQISVINSQLNHYGFQAEVVDLSGNNTGTILPGINQRVVNVNNISIVEQTTPLTTGLNQTVVVPPSQFCVISKLHPTPAPVFQLYAKKG